MDCSYSRECDPIAASVVSRIKMLSPRTVQPATLNTTLWGMSLHSIIEKLAFSSCISSTLSKKNALVSAFYLLVPSSSPASTIRAFPWCKNVGIPGRPALVLTISISTTKRKKKKKREKNVGH